MKKFDFCQYNIYIYIYIYSHRQIDCFVVSQLFSVARHVGRLMLGSKPGQLFVWLSTIPLGQQANHVSSGIVRHYVVAFVSLHFALPDTRELNSFEELCMMRVKAVIFHQNLNNSVKQKVQYMKKKKKLNIKKVLFEFWYQITQIELICH